MSLAKIYYVYSMTYRYGPFVTEIESECMVSVIIAEYDWRKSSRPIGDNLYEVTNGTSPTSS